ncbi:cytochrome P450 4d2-like isoform X2 [Pectinophora gossypiella]|uniref:cytochrome P450 4d2-like isoform X2 n=1 Tax=Pectinophora gossypiella TaxID=13191 RepID=UPI00214E9BBC|nr:cytochrome P450 4d2-like isoform X2 [Pectinophora gossypiella]
MIPIIAVVLLIILTFWINVLRIRRKTTLPGPFPLPLVGNGLMFLGDGAQFLQTVDKLVQDYDNAFSVTILSRNYSVLVDPKLIEPIISNAEYNTKGVSYYYLRPWLGQGLLTASGNRWQTHRKFLTPAFHFNILQNFLPVFCKNTKILTEKLNKLADGNTSFDLFPIIALAALDNVTESIMGVCVNAQKNSKSEYVKSIEELSSLISTRMRNPIVAEDAIFNLLPHKGRQDRALKVLHGQTMKVIEARREELKKMNISELKLHSEFGIKNKHAFLDLLLMAEIDGSRIDDEKVREEVDTFMFEGHDTTTSGIVFCMFCISKRNDVQEKLLSEQRSIFGDEMDRDPTYNELAQMKYLECVIRESLRLYPSVPFIERLIIRDTDVAGLHLPSNTSVIFDIFHMQRRKEVYSDPLEFIPERFQNDSKESKNAFSWLPFSAGPRNCIGQKFAMMELKVTMSAVIRSFKLLPSNKEPLLSADLILRSKNGVHVKMIRRS